MYTVQTIFTALQRTVLIMALLALAACGSKDEPNCSQTLAVLTVGLCLIGEVSHSSTPSTPPAPPPTSEPPPTSGTGSGSIPPPPSSNIVVMRRVVEYESNSTLDNANPVAFRNATPDEHIGIDITGSVSQGGDTSDFFVLTPPRSGHFLVYLCEETCSDIVHSDQVYLMVYDQSQSTIASTPVGTVEKQQLGVDMYAGLAYYVEVNGYNTGPSPLEYKLVIID